MILLHFAHRGEAQSFIKHFAFTPVEGDQKFYISQGKDLYLLISGEGPMDTLMSTSYYLGKYPVKEIINIGIAGSLNSKIELDQFIQIRTCYGYNENSPKFHSYTTTASQQDNGRPVFDCITTEQRVLSDEFADILRPFADIVDRELWGLGKVATNYKIPFSSFKLISDVAGNNTACFDLKERAKTFSDKMLEEFLKLNIGSVEDENELEIEIPFHASFTQKKRIEKLFQKIKYREDKTLAELITASNIKLENSSKQTANEFIEYLENFINPINKEIEILVKNIMEPFTQIGVNIKYDKKLDQKKFVLQMEINSTKNLEKLSNAIEKFDYDKIQKIWDGQIDV